MNTYQHLVRAIAEPTLAAICGTAVLLGGLYLHEPKIFTHPSHYMPDVPNELYLLKVKEMPGCHERVKRKIMIAGEMTEEEFNPDVSIMICDRGVR